MVKIPKRVVEAAEAQEKDYLIWDDELPGFGLRVFSSGKRSYVIQYRTKGRSRRYTIGLHGAWAPETARREAKVQLGRVAGGDDPVEDRQLDHKAITEKELCTRYLADLQAGLILGKGGRPKKASTIITDTGRIERHIIPLIGSRRIKDLTKTDINKVLKDIMAGMTRVSVKTKKLRGKAIVRGGRNGHAHRWSSRRHSYLRRRGGHHRKQPRPRYPQAKGQCAKAAAIGGGVPNTRSDPPRRWQAGKIRYDRGLRSPACADRLPPQRDDRA